jgi:hypothetical protein
MRIEKDNRQIRKSELMITQTEIRSGREVKTLKDLGISANVTHGNL